MTKVTYIISDVNKALAFEWIAEHIDPKQVELSFVLLNPDKSSLFQFLQDRSYTVHWVKCRGKKDWPLALGKTIRILRTIEPDIVHCHLLQANIIGLIAARLTGVKTRIYTRHHSSLHHVYFKKGVFWDKLANRLATKVVAISGVVKQILVKWEHVSPQKVILIPHGFLLDEFAEVPEERTRAFREKHGLTGLSPVVGVISRFTEWKGVQYIIPAFRELLRKYPNSVLILLNATGDYTAALLKQLEGLPADRYRLIKFERDVAAAYRSMDLFIHVPIDEHSEAFGQIYIEALASGVPSIFTRSGIANEEHFNHEVAIIADHKCPDQILQGMERILEDKVDTMLRVQAGKVLAKRYELPVYIHQLEKLYSQP